MEIRPRRLSARRNRDSALLVLLLMLPLLVLMPFLHGHPLGAVGSDHPVGVHFPMAGGPSGASSLVPGQRAAAEGGAPATIVVQESRPRANGRSLSPRRTAFIERVRGLPVLAAASHTVRPGPQVERPQPWLHEQRAQAPPAMVAAVAAAAA